MIDLNGQHLKDQEINLGNDSNLVHKLLGVTMENCTLNFKVSGNGVSMARSKFYGCTFNFKTKMRYPLPKLISKTAHLQGKCSAASSGVGKPIRKGKK